MEHKGEDVGVSMDQCLEKMSCETKAAESHLSSICGFVWSSGSRIFVFLTVNVNLRTLRMQQCACLSSHLSVIYLTSEFIPNIVAKAAAGFSSRRIIKLV